MTATNSNDMGMNCLSRVGLIGALCLLLVPGSVLAQAPEDEDPLDRTTPRGTVAGYLSAMEAGDATLAAQYIDLRNLPEEVTRYTPEQIARGLYLVMQRALWVDLAQLSTDPDGQSADGLPTYRDALGVAETADGTITVLLQRVPGDEGGSIWKFSNRTIADLPELYAEYRYPPPVEWLAARLPPLRFLGLELFKWVAALSVALAAAPVVLLVAWLTSRFITQADSPFRGRLRRLLMGPASALALLALFNWTIRYLGLGEEARRVVRAQTLTILVLLWLLWQSLDFLRHVYSHRFRRTGREAAIALLRPLISMLKITVLLIAILVWLDNLGYEITALLAGLGVGGLAVALVLQRPLEDVFGAISLYTTQPIRVGDFGRYGGFKGTIEEIGLRTTRIRTLENTLISIPNMRLASEPIDNLSARRRILYRRVLTLRHDTSTQKITACLAGIRELLSSTPEVIEEGARARLTDVGLHGFEIEVFAYVDETVWSRYLEIAERITIGILQIIDDLDVSLARPLDALREHPA